MLTEKLAEMKCQMLTTVEELERQCKVVEELNGQLRRSHACWPSRWGWGTVIALLFYLFFFSTGRIEHETHRALAQKLDTLEQRLIEVEVMKAHTHPTHIHPEHTHPTTPTKKRWWQR